MASSFQGQRLSAEQVRANFRKSLSKVADPLDKATIVFAIKDDPDGLMPADKVGDDIDVMIPVWPDRLPGATSKLYLEYWYEGLPDFVPIHADPEEVPDSKPVGEFPLDRKIPLQIFAGREGTFQFRYRVVYFNLNESFSTPTPVTIDTLGPLQPDASPEAMQIAEPMITDATLARDNGVKCVVPPFVENKKEFVRVAVGWMATLPEDESDFPDLVAVFELLPQPSQEVVVPKKWITDLGSIVQYVVYFLFDKAGNRSQMSLPKSVKVALGELPADMEICEVPLEKQDGLYDRADAGIPETVVIQDYTGSEGMDGIVIQWGDTTLARTSVEAHLPWPLKIRVPWTVKRDEYDFTGPQYQTIKVDYTIYRGDQPFPSPGAIDVRTDYKMAGPPNPDPGPINPALIPIVFRSSEGSDTELTPDDYGDDATGTIKLWDAPVPEVGDELTLYYNGTAVLPPYIIKTGDGPGKDIPISIPWTDVIEKTLVMDDLEMHYTLTQPGLNNPQESVRTKINVMLEAVDLPEPIFLEPDDPTTPITIMNCSHLRQINGQWGITVHIPTSRYLKEGVEITLSWMSYAADQVTELKGTGYPDTFTVSKEQEDKGIDWFVPNDRCLAPIYRPGIESGGFGKVIYSLDVRGTIHRSDLVPLLIGMFEEFPKGSGNGHCQLTRPPRV